MRSITPYLVGMPPLAAALLPSAGIEAMATAGEILPGAPAAGTSRGLARFFVDAPAGLVYANGPARARTAHAKDEAQKAALECLDAALHKRGDGDLGALEAYLRRDDVDALEAATALLKKLEQTAFEAEVHRRGPLLVKQVVVELASNLAEGDTEDIPLLVQTRLFRYFNLDPTLARCAADALMDHLDVNPELALEEFPAGQPPPVKEPPPSLRLLKPHRPMPRSEETALKHEPQGLRGDRLYLEALKQILASGRESANSSAQHELGMGLWENAYKLYVKHGLEGARNACRLLAIGSLIDDGFRGVWLGSIIAEIANSERIDTRPGRRTFASLFLEKKLAPGLAEALRAFRAYT